MYLLICMHRILNVRLLLFISRAFFKIFTSNMDTPSAWTCSISIWHNTITQIQRIMKVLTALHYVHVWFVWVFFYTVIPKWNKFIFSPSNHNVNVKKKSCIFLIIKKNKMLISLHSIWSRCCCWTFGSIYSLKSFGIWYNKLGTPMFELFRPFLFSAPLMLHQVG